MCFRFFIVSPIQKSSKGSRLSQSKVCKILLGGDDCRNFEPKTRLKFENLDKSIQKLRAIYKVHPEWFEVPKPKSDKRQNEIDYSVK